MLDELVTSSFKAFTVSYLNKTSNGICTNVWSNFYLLSAKASFQGSVLFLCIWCHSSPSRPVRNAGNAALSTDSGPGLSGTIKSLSFNLSKKVNYFTVNKQIGSNENVFCARKLLCKDSNIRIYIMWWQFVHTELSLFWSPSAALVQPCRIHLPCADGKREKRHNLYQKRGNFCWTEPKVDCVHYQKIMSNRGCLGNRVRMSFQQSGI